MKKRLVNFICVLLSLCMLQALAACGGEMETGKTGNKVAYITGVGGLGDQAFNDLGYEGIKNLKANGVECDVAEPLGISELEGLIRNFAASEDYGLIVAMGVDSVEPLEKVANDYPGQVFLIIDGQSEEENIKSVEVLQTETGFLAGAYAALLMRHSVIRSETDVLGAVGGMDIPLIRGILTGFECGARYVNPDMKVLTSYVGDWNDPGTASEQASAMYEQGTSVVFAAAGASGLGVIERAQNTGLYALGYDGNQNAIAPDNMVGSAIRGLGDIIVETANQVFDGTFQGGYVTYSIKESGTASQILTDGSNLDIPDVVMEELAQVQKNFAATGLDIPSEPDGIGTFLSSLGTFA